MAHHGDEGKQSLLLLWKLLAENCVQLFNSWAVAPEKLWSSQLEGGSEAVVLDGEALQQLVGVALNVNTFGNFESLETILLATAREFVQEELFYFLGFAKLFRSIFNDSSKVPWATGEPLLLGPGDEVLKVRSDNCNQLSSLAVSINPDL